MPNSGKPEFGERERGRSANTLTIE